MTPLQLAAVEVVNRWHTPLWKDVPHTANYIYTLNTEVQNEINRSKSLSDNTQDLVYRLNKRAEIRRGIKDRKSVQEVKPDRIVDLLEEAAREILKLRSEKEKSNATL